MTNKELREKIASLETELAELEEKSVRLKAKLEEAKKAINSSGVFKPKDGQTYWYISASGEVYREVWHCHGCYSIGNCYPTQQSAMDAVRALRLIQKARESQDGFVPDWEDGEQVKFSLKFRMGDIIIENCHLINTAPIFGFWGDALACEKFIDENEDDLRWFFTEYRG